jgi:hypothetical protein
MRATPAFFLLMEKSIRDSSSCPALTAIDNRIISIGATSIHASAEADVLTHPQLALGYISYDQVCYEKLLIS